MSIKCVLLSSSFQIRVLNKLFFYSDPDDIIKSTLDQRIEALVKSLLAINISLCFSRLQFSHLFRQEFCLDQITLRGTSCSEIFCCHNGASIKKTASSSGAGESQVCSVPRELSQTLALEGGGRGLLSKEDSSIC